MLGSPQDWKGRTAGIGWEGPTITDCHESWAWHYGSLCISFSDTRLARLFPGVSLDYSGILKPVFFRSPFQELPQVPFTISELTDFLLHHGVRFRMSCDYMLISEGGVAAVTRAGDTSPSAPVDYFWPNEY